MPFSQAVFDYQYSYRQLRIRARLAQTPGKIAEWNIARNNCDFLADHCPERFQKACVSMTVRRLPDPLAKPFVARFEDAQTWNL